jgi:heat shock protein HtpX
MKRIFLFLVTNLAVLVVLSITARLLGVDRFLMSQGGGINMSQLLVFAALFGMGGSFLSLAMSKWTAKHMTGAQVIEQPANEVEAWLVRTVEDQARRAGIGMPEVAIFDSPDPNAFATGMNRNNALVAVSTGLLQRMNKREVEAVLAHEVSHVANGDMVTLALIQGVVNTFVIFLSRLVGSIVDRALSRGEEYQGPGVAYWVTSIVTEILFGVLASVVVMWFSRQREYRADHGGATLTSPAQMIAALERLKSSVEGAHRPGRLAAFGISDKTGGGLGRLFLSHPPLDERIAALRAAQG